MKTESLADRALDLLNLPVGCSINWGKSMGARITIDCPTIGERDRMFENIAPFCNGALKMGYSHCLIRVARTQIRHYCKLTALLAFDAELDGLSPG
jgi:hypothetical protein